jgi:putative phosphoribosyl transferase
MDLKANVTSAEEPIEVSVGAGEVVLAGTLRVPTRARGIVLFAHGSGSSRQSPRNAYVAGVFHSRQIATLLFDLLTGEEESIDRLTAEFRFEIPTLARRLIGATSWVEDHPDVRGLPIAYFGASTGAAAALVAAAELDGRVKSVVSRGGRPDLAGDALEAVRVPTLLIVGENDPLVIEINRNALERLASRESKLVIVPGATHLFEETGAIEEVARVAADWFRAHFAPSFRLESDAFAHR